MIRLQDTRVIYKSYLISYPPVGNSRTFKLKHSALYINNKGNNKDIHKDKASSVCKIYMRKTTLSDDRKVSLHKRSNVDSETQYY